VFRLTSALRRSWPPPPHDPRERVVLCPADHWQVRAFLFNDPRFQYLAPRGLWHIQLWHPGAGVSVLTPSALTGGRYEIFPIQKWKRRAESYEELLGLLQVFHDITPPSAGMLHALESLFVRGPVELFLESDPLSHSHPPPSGREPAIPSRVHALLGRN
jgi:hypothetical protein